MIFQKIQLPMLILLLYFLLAIPVARSIALNDFIAGPEGSERKKLQNLDSYN